MSKTVATTNVRPVSSTSDPSRTDLYSSPQKLPSSQQKGAETSFPPIQTEETMMINMRPQLISYSSELISSKLLNIMCFNHKNRILDQICLKEDCEFQERRLFCSKCAISEETHVKLHRTSLFELERFIQSRIEEMQSNALEVSIDDSINDIKELKLKIKRNNENIQIKIEKDFKELINNMVSYMDEIARDMKIRLQKYFEMTMNTLDEKDNELARISLRMKTEQAYVFNDLGRFLEIIDVTKESQVNEFFANFMKNSQKFGLEPQFNLLKHKCDAIKKKLKEAKFYDEAIFQDFKKKTLEDLHSSHFKRNLFLDLPEIEFLTYEKPPPEPQFKPQADSFRYETNASINSIQLSLRNKLNTENYQGINSISVDNERNLLVTCSNDHILKIWMFNEKPVFILLDTITLSNTTLSMRLSPVRNSLYVGSGNEIQCYAIDLQSQDRIIKLTHSFSSHKQQIKALEIYEEFGKLVSISQDQALMIWDLKNASCLKTLELSRNFRITTKGSGGLLALGSLTGYLMVKKIDEVQINEKAKEKQVFKESLTAISFLNTQKIAVGSKKGRIKLFDIDTMEKFCDIKDINKASLIYGIMPFNSQNEQRFVLVLSWGGEISVWDTKEKKKCGSYQHSLRNNSEKHLNFQGSAYFSSFGWICTSGNNDKFLEVIEFSVR